MVNEIDDYNSPRKWAKREILETMVSKLFGEPTNLIFVLV